MNCGDLTCEVLSLAPFAILLIFLFSAPVTDGATRRVRSLPQHQCLLPHPLEMVTKVDRLVVPQDPGPTFTETHTPRDEKGEPSGLPSGVSSGPVHPLAPPENVTRDARTDGRPVGPGRSGGELPPQRPYREWTRLPFGDGMQLPFLPRADAT